jgi:hypothetical protein
MVKNRRTPQPKTAKALTKTKPTPSKTDTIPMTGMPETKKGGHHADDESFYNRLGDLCKYRGLHGMTKVPQSVAELVNWVHYIMKRKV